MYALAGTICQKQVVWVAGVTVSLLNALPTAARFQSIIPDLVSPQHPFHISKHYINLMEQHARDATCQSSNMPKMPHANTLGIAKIEQVHDVAFDRPFLNKHTCCTPGKISTMTTAPASASRVPYLGDVQPEHHGSSTVAVGPRASWDGS